MAAHQPPPPHPSPQPNRPPPTPIESMLGATEDIHYLSSPRAAEQESRATLSIGIWVSRTKPMQLDPSANCHQSLPTYSVNAEM